MTDKSDTKQVLNLPLDVVDTGFDSYPARIEDAAGIDIAMCFSHADATAIANACNSALVAENERLKLALQKCRTRLKGIGAGRIAHHVVDDAIEAAEAALSTKAIT